jgi:GxxExxY protein
MYTPTIEEEQFATAIVKSSFAVHKYLGPGLIESVYERCLRYELDKRGIKCLRQQRLPLIYEGIKISRGLRLDLLVGDRLICELKSKEVMIPLYVAQILTQLRLADLHLGLLINFNVERIKDGIRRIIRS